MKLMKYLAALIVIPAMLLAGCSGLAVNLQTTPNASVQNAPVAVATQAPIVKVANPVQTTAQATVPADLAAFQNTFESIYQQVAPSVVFIDVMIGNTSTSSNGNSQNNNPFGNSPFGNSPFGNPAQQTPSEALGSGFVWDTQGHIVTNNHVVAGASQITVTFFDGTTASATVVGTDPNADLAVIKVDVPASELHPVTIADSHQVKVGQVSIAIGNPFGEGWTMTTGIISALERSLPVGENQNTTGPNYSIPDIIQTDASINPGNSGGVLLDVNGQVIGVTAAIESSTQSNSGIGFVIPSAIVQKVVPSLIQNGKYAHPYLGISGTDVNLDIAKANNLPSDQRGVIVVDVTSGGPADKSGIQGSSTNNAGTPVGGDVITAINGQAIKTFGDLSANLFYNGQPGQAVTLTILRNGQQRDVKVTLGTIPAGGQ